MFVNSVLYGFTVIISLKESLTRRRIFFLMSARAKYFLHTHGFEACKKVGSECGNMRLTGCQHFIAVPSIIE